MLKTVMLLNYFLEIVIFFPGFYDEYKAEKNTFFNRNIL